MYNLEVIGKPNSCSNDQIGSEIVEIAQILLRSRKFPFPETSENAKKGGRFGQWLAPADAPWSDTGQNRSLKAAITDTVIDSMLATGKPAETLHAVSLSANSLLSHAVMLAWYVDI